MTKERSKKKIIIIAVIAIVVVVIIGANWAGNGDDSTQVQTDLVYNDEISELVTASGRIEPQTKVDITAEVSAQIFRVFVKEGDYVMVGQSLILLDTVQLKSDVSQARYSLDEITARAAAAKTQYEKDKLEAERQSSLYEQGLTSETEYTNAQFAYESSKANYEAMLAQQKTGQARLEKAQDQLSKAHIVAPMEGIVTYLDAEAGEIAQAQTAFTQGRTLATIADLSVFEVEVDVDETEIAKVSLDQPADIRVDAFRDTTFEGSVVEIGNSARVEGQGTENYATTFRVKVRFSKPEANIRPGMSATVDITTAKEENATLIPYASVVVREFDTDSLQGEPKAADQNNGMVRGVNAAEIDADTAAKEPEAAEGDNQEKKEKVKKSGVYVVKNGVAKFVEVETGIADDLNVVALTGVSPGDTVISGSFQTLRKLEDGDEVSIDERSMKKMRDEDE